MGERAPWWRLVSSPAAALFDFIEGWYNPHRRHCALGYLSPNDFERAAGGPPARRRPVLLDDLLSGRGPRDVDLYELQRR